MEKISTRRLDLIPSINELEKICKSLFVLDKIVGSKYNLFKFTKIDNNSSFYSYQFDEKNIFFSGEDFFCIFFSGDGVIIIGNSIDSLMNDYTRSYFPGVLDDVPNEFKKFVDIFYDENSYIKKYRITYCIWRKFSDNKWNIGNIDFSTLIYEGDTDLDFSQEHLFIFDGKTETYLEWITEYCGYRFLAKVDISLIDYIYQHKPINEEIAKKINPDCNFDQIKYKIIEVGYPIA